MQIGMGGTLSNKRNDKTKEKEKKRRSKLFNLQDLLSNDTDNIKGKSNVIGKNEDKEFEDFLKALQTTKKRSKASHEGDLTKKHQTIEEQ